MGAVLYEVKGVYIMRVSAINAGLMNNTKNVKVRKTDNTPAFNGNLGKEAGEIIKNSNKKPHRPGFFIRALIGAGSILTGAIKIFTEPREKIVRDMSPEDADSYMKDIITKDIVFGQ